MYKYILLSIQATLILIIITCIVTNDKGVMNTARFIAAYFGYFIVGKFVTRKFKEKV